MNSSKPMLSEQAFHWLTLLSSGKVSADDRCAFEAWRDADSTHAAAYADAQALWQSDDLAVSLNGLRLASPPIPDLRRSDLGMEDKAKVVALPRRRPSLLAAAALAASLVLIAFSPPFDTFRLTIIADHVAATGERTTIGLDDGSTLVLNSQSAASVAYSAGERRVVLHAGEAFFDVKRDSVRPFVVEAEGSSFRVLGTAFSVSQIAGGTRLAVREGLVGVTGEAGGGARIGAGFGVEVVDGTAGSVQSIHPERAFAWLQGRIVFSNEPLAQVVDALDAHHSAQVLLLSDRAREHRVSGNYRLSDPNTAILDMAKVAGAEVVFASDLLIVLR